MTRHVDALLDDLIEKPFPDTTSADWKRVKKAYSRDIEGLTVIEQYIYKQFAYTINKGEKIKLCLQDAEGEVDRDLNMYVLIHEITHIFDKKYLTTANAHDEYFWVVFSKMITRAIQLNLVNPSIFDSSKKRCGTQIL